LLLACRHPRVQKWVRQSAHRTEPRTRLECLPAHQLPVPFCSSGTLSPFPHFLCRCWQDLEQRKEPDAPQVNTAFLWQPWRAHSFRGRASAVLTHLVWLAFYFPTEPPPSPPFHADPPLCLQLAFRAINHSFHNPLLGKELSNRARPNQQGSEGVRQLSTRAQSSGVQI
jgi:hypothetical protein